MCFAVVVDGGGDIVAIAGGFAVAAVAVAVARDS